MEHSKGREDETQKGNDRDLLRERKSEATSDETLSELEETRKFPGPNTSRSSPGPSPDGLVDEPDEIKNAGPM